MARARKGERVTGPYLKSDGRTWELRIVGADGTKFRPTFASETAAETERARIERTFAERADTTIADAIEAYREHLTCGEENRPGSITTTLHRLCSFFPELDMTVCELTPARCAQYYATLRVAVSPRTGRIIANATHRNTLVEAKAFTKWCVTQGWLPRNPMEAVKPVGKPNKRKAQLTEDEARRWNNTALALAEKEDGAVAALVALWMGFRAGEIVERIVRDVDRNGTVLRITSAKTDAGIRAVPIPALLQPLIARLVRNKQPHEYLFAAASTTGHRDRGWPCDWARRISRAAGTPAVTAHGLRGTLASLTVASGVPAEILAGVLGHEDTSTTLNHYARPEAIEHQKQRRDFRLLAGGAA